jgi:hypothetical protein
MFSNLGLPPATKFEAPFPAWNQKDIWLVEQAIVSAWQHLGQDPNARDVLSSGGEVEISHKMVEMLETILNSSLIKGFTGRRFCPPIRGQELQDVSGTYLEKRPDLTFRLTSSQPYTQHNALFFECKRISPKNSVSAYVQKGLVRFCDQRYAWGMSHAGMLAFVQNLTPAPQAKTNLEKYWAKNPASPTVPISPLTVDAVGATTVTISQHSRKLLLPNGNASTDIMLRHIWLTT